MPYSRPTSYPSWTTGNTGVQIEPTSPQKFSGAVPNMRLSSQWFNWLFGNVSDWINWLDQLTQVSIGSTAYDAIVGSGTQQYATINLALAAVSPGARILVTIDLALTATQQITKNNVLIEFKPGVTVSKSSASTGIQISATGVRLKGGRITGFSGGGDKAILIDSGSDFSLIGEFRFAGNNSGANDIVDNNGKGATYGLIQES